MKLYQPQILHTKQTKKVTLTKSGLVNWGAGLIRETWVKSYLQEHWWKSRRPLHHDSSTQVLGVIHKNNILGALGPTYIILFQTFPIYSNCLDLKQLQEEPCESSNSRTFLSLVTFMNLLSLRRFISFQDLMIH